MKENRIYYRRHLPHYQPLEAEYHVVFRLAGPLPVEVIKWMRQELKTERKRISALNDETQKRANRYRFSAAYFAKYEKLLDGSASGPHWLADQRVAAIVAGAIYFRDKKKYDLHAFTIMPNHVHMIFATVRRAGLW